MADEKSKGVQDAEDQSQIVEDEQDGATQGTENNTGDDGAGAHSGTNDKQGKTFTQEQVNRMMTREKNQGRAAALRELGIDPKDAKAMAMVKALVASQKTDEQRAAEEAAAADAKQRENDRRVAVAEAKAEAMAMDAQPQYVDDIVALAMSKMDAMAEAGETGDLKTIIGEYKSKYPAWFKPAGDDEGQSKSKNAGQRGTGSSVRSNPGNKDKGANKGLGARLAAQRKTTTKSSYWGGIGR